MIERKPATEKLLTVNIGTKLKLTLRELAEEDDRTLSSLVKMILLRYVRQRALAKAKSETN
jgi:hypothetical protein